MLEKIQQKQETEDINAFEEMKKEIERRYSWNGKIKILSYEREWLNKLTYTEVMIGMETERVKVAQEELKVILGGDRAHKAGDLKKLLLCSRSYQVGNNMLILANEQEQVEWNLE